MEVSVHTGPTPFELVARQYGMAGHMWWTKIVPVWKPETREKGDAQYLFERHDPSWLEGL